MLLFCLIVEIFRDRKKNNNEFTTVHNTTELEDPTTDVPPQHEDYLNVNFHSNNVPRQNQVNSQCYFIKQQKTMLVFAGFCPGTVTSCGTESRKLKKQQSFVCRARLV